MKMKYSVASEKDLPFIMEVYNQNIEALHGNYRNSEVWRKLLSDINSAYYIVCSENPVAWFRVDYNEYDSMELGIFVFRLFSYGNWTMYNGRWSNKSRLYIPESINLRFVNYHFIEE